MSGETVEITIGGQAFTLRAHTGIESLEAMAAYANAKLSEVTEGSETLTTRVALLALLNLTEELFSERAKHRELLKNIESRAERIQEYLNSMDQTQ
ncbi:cell division protein ZapA [Myxococcota bacterium]|nr:cell division protein ZapA [Myxococcota bacterium]MBU1537740.1 cell division protein ZapA [Myxococcota bacterium]